VYVQIISNLYSLHLYRTFRKDLVVILKKKFVAPESQQLEEPQSPEVKVRQEFAFEVTKDGNPSVRTMFLKSVSHL